MAYNSYSREALVDEEAGEIAQDFSAFSDKVVRLGFIRKVYGILLAQLIVTIAFICLFLFVEPIAEYSNKNPWLWAFAMVLTFVCLITLACCPDVRRNFPSNLILLGLFTLCESFLLGAAASCYKKEEVLMAVGITSAVVLGLTAFAMQSKSRPYFPAVSDYWSVANTDSDVLDPDTFYRELHANPGEELGIEDGVKHLLYRSAMS